MRAHYGDHVLDGEGRPIAGAAVYVYQQGTTTPITETIYTTDDTVGSTVASNPISTTTSGRYDIWLADEKRVTLTITKAGYQDQTFDVDVLELTSTSSIQVRKNSGANVGSRPRVNFIEGSNITLTVADDNTDNEVDVTIAGTAASITPADAAPPAIGTAAVGVSTDYAREDHTHSGAAYQALSDLGFVRKTSDEAATSDTALTGDSQLLLPLLASTAYEFECLVFATGDQAGDIAVAFEVPAGATLLWGGFGLGTGATSDTFDMRLRGETGSVSSRFFGLVGAAIITPLLLKGVVSNGSTAGNLRLHWAQGTSSATATTVLTNSFLKTRKVA